MSPQLLIMCAACLLAMAGIALFWAQRAERRRTQAASAFVDLRRTQAANVSAEQHRGIVTATAQTTPAPASVGKKLLERPFERFPELENLFLRAGIEAHTRWLAVNISIILLITMIAGMFAGSLGFCIVLLVSILGTIFRFWLMITRREKRIVRQIPTFLDLLVRQVTVGTSLGSAFQQIAPKTNAPLGEILNRAAQLNRAGVDLDVAVKQTARMYRVEQLLMIGSVLGVSTKFGGRSDQVLERIAGFMRDIEQAQDELVALSSETRMSAWILGALPVLVAAFLMIFNSQFFMGMWNDPLGRKMLLGAVMLQIIGSILLYRLAKSV